MHSVNNQLNITVEEVITTIMEANNILTASGDWIAKRREYLNTRPEAVAETVNYVYTLDLGKEISKVVELLQPAILSQYLGIRKNMRFYHCPTCYAYVAASQQTSSLYKLAQLTNRSPECNTIHCIVCNSDCEIERKKCDNPDCPGNVIAITHWGSHLCLTCLYCQSTRLHGSTLFEENNHYE